MPYDPTDVRAKLATAATTTPERFSGSEHVKFGELPPAEKSDGVKTWYARGQNFVVGYSELTGEARFDVADAPEWSFANEIVPVFTKAGCNTGGCHGSPSGRGGFRLSLFGYEPDYDYDQVTKEKNGARINKNQPETSLIPPISSSPESAA